MCGGIRGSMKSKISKRTGIIIFCGLAAIMAAIIVIHHNPLADRQEELLKKAVSCGVIVVSCVLFGLLYDKITSLPHVVPSRVGRR